jgi:hypothetical protein
VAANLIDSIQNFRWSVGPTLNEEGASTGKEYTLTLQEGVIAALYLRSWQAQEQSLEAGGTVLIAPVYTFLVANRPVEVQFWLDVGSQDWFQRLHQPVTHPFVLSRTWSRGKVWDADDEYAAAQDSLRRMVMGLLQRCRRKVYLGISDLNEEGYEQRSPLLIALQRLLRRYHPAPTLNSPFERP